MDKRREDAIKKLQDQYPKVAGVQYDIGKRWEDGIPHNPKSLAVYKAMEAIDFTWCNDHHGFKSGGDGDNGEALMYLMDIYFDEQDVKASNAESENWIKRAEASCAEAYPGFDTPRIISFANDASRGWPKTIQALKLALRSMVCTCGTTGEDGMNISQHARECQLAVAYRIQHGDFREFS